jgi:phosphorylase kinase alpha/beta subunit
MEEYYTSYDMALLADKLVTHFAFLTMNWRNMLGRPTITLVAAKSYLGNVFPSRLSIESLV